MYRGEYSAPFKAFWYAALTGAIVLSPWYYWGLGAYFTRPEVVVQIAAVAAAVGLTFYGDER